MIILETTKIYAKFENGELIHGKLIVMPDDADTSAWKEFENLEKAKEFYGIKNDN